MVWAEAHAVLCGDICLFQNVHNGGGVDAKCLIHGLIMCIDVMCGELLQEEGLGDEEIKTFGDVCVDL